MPRVPTVIPEPMIARLTDRLPIGPAWSYEVKWDGLTASYPAVAAALRTLKAH